MTRPVQVVCCGEGMLELSRREGQARLAWAGDTLNTAVHMARMGIPTAYLTALGTDPFSEDMIAAWQEEGLDCSLVLRHPTRVPGLYAISTDATGERSFTYWRSESAARAMFAMPQMAEARDEAVHARLFYFSLISLAILPDEGREALIALAADVRAGGGAVAFDSNYRPRLWASAHEAVTWRDRAIATAAIGLPTLEDEQALQAHATAAGVGVHWTALGCPEVVVKQGAGGCLLPDGSQSLPPRHLVPVDTSGAGDAFNAAYLAARLAGRPPSSAAAEGHALAGWTIMHPGAIPPPQG